MYHERNKGNATVVGAVNSRLGVGWDSSQRACEFGRPGQDQPVCSMMGSATDMSRQQTSVKLHRLRTTVVAYSAVVATRAGPCIHTYICDSELVACAKLLPGRLLVPILFRLRLPAHFQCLEFFFIDLLGWVFVAHCDGTDLAFKGG